MLSNMVWKTKRKFSSNRQEEKKVISTSINKIYATVVILIIGSLAYYISSLNQNATKWYIIKTLEIQKKELQLNQEILKVRLAETQSLNYLLSSTAFKEMEKSGSYDYIVIENYDNLTLTTNN